jgi:type II restriction enzyme
MDLIKEFQDLLKEGTITISELSAFLSKKRAEYVTSQVRQLEQQGHLGNVAYNKASQSWRTTVGNALQSIIFGVLQEYFEGKDIKLTSDKHLSEQNSKSPELDLVRRMLLIHYNKYSFLPDADIIIYTYREAILQVKILAIISIKNSFRERGFETTYWSIKLKDNPNTHHIKFFLSTPDVDDEIAYIDGRNGPRKMRVIMEYELDSIYMLRQKDCERTEKVKGFEDLFQDILSLVELQTT